MATLTKAELNRLLIESQNQNAQLREQLSIARAEIERLRAAVQPQQTQLREIRVRDPHLRETLEKARALAMRTGRSVKVTL